MFKKISIIVLILCLVPLLFVNNSQAKEEYTIGVNIRDLSADFFNVVLKGVEKKASEIGGINLVVQDAHLDEAKQLNQIDALIQKDVDAVILVPQDPRAIITGIKKLNKNDIPVITIDTEPAGGKVDLFMAFDNTAAGKSAGQSLVRQIENKYGKIPEGIVLEIGGNVRHLAEQQRSGGFNEVLDKYDNLKVVKKPANWKPSKAFEVTTDLLGRYGDKVLGIYTQSDYMTPGIAEALRQKNRLHTKEHPDHIVFTSIDGAPVALDLMKDNYKMTTSVLQPGNSYGELALKYAIDYLEGKELPKPGETIKKEGALWSPAKVIKSDIGPKMLMNNVVIGEDVKPDDPRLWGNMLE